MRDAFAAFVRSVFVCSIFILAACSDNGSSRNTVITGTVLDGPIVGATVVVYDVHGQVILTTTSDDAANYRVDIPVDAQLPVRVEISGGTDLVTGRAADFRMEALVNETGEQTVNVSPLTTLAVQAAACAGDQSDAGVERMWEVIR